MAEHPETAAQATRRRWITFGEIVAVVAVVISAASWWDSREARGREDASESRRERAVSALILTATPVSDGDELRLAAARDDQVIQSQQLTAPGGQTSDSTGPATIPESLIADAARAMKAKSGRVPVAILTRYVVDGEMHEDSALYDVGYHTHERVLRSDGVTLTGLSLVKRLSSGDPAKAVEARYAKRS